MANNKTSGWTLAFAVFGAMLLLSGIIGMTSLSEVIAQDTDPGVHFHASLPLYEGDVLRVHTLDGNITYETWTGSDIDIEAVLKVVAPGANASERYAELVAVDMSRVADGVVATAQAAEGARLLRRTTVDFHVRVPEGWSGRVELRTTNGAVTAGGSDGDVRIETYTGPIRVRGHRGTLQARTSNGAIVLSDVDAALELDTSNGSISVEFARLRGVGHARASNGAIRLHGAFDPEAVFEVDTYNGAVSLMLEEPDVALDMVSTNGAVRSQVEVHASERTEGHLVGVIGEGRAKLSARTVNGTIDLRRGSGGGPG